MGIAFPLRAVKPALTTTWTKFGDRISLPDAE
jgi:hypothetical protein